MGEYTSALMCFGFTSKKESNWAFGTDSEGEQITWGMFFEDNPLPEGAYAGVHQNFDYPMRMIYSRIFISDEGEVTILPNILTITEEEIKALKDSLLVIKQVSEEAYNQLTDNGKVTEPYWFLVLGWALKRLLSNKIKTTNWLKNNRYRRK